MLILNMITWLRDQRHPKYFVRKTVFTKNNGVLAIVFSFSILLIFIFFGPQKLISVLSTLVFEFFSNPNYSNLSDSENPKNRTKLDSLYYNALEELNFLS
jgi:hypothetical protein